jgi:predicted nucleotidyltransferase
MIDKEQILQKIISVVNENEPDSEVYLYGSQARGDSERFSDWDLLILLNRQNITFDFEIKMMDDFYEIELETGEIFSPLIYSKSDWNINHSITPLFENIQREGVRIK